jgi:lipoprotein-anchoring transpeptidase ErfK/SrfK
MRSQPQQKTQLMISEDTTTERRSSDRKHRGAVAVALALVTVVAFAASPRAQGVDSTAAGVAVDSPRSLQADLTARTLHLRLGDTVAQSFPVAIGTHSKPTPTGKFKIRKIVWNPAWVPPDENWAKGKKAQPPGAKANPMKLVKIFFREPDYYIHGTSETESLGERASHGCLRMDPDDAYRVARYIMEHGGAPRDENWFWRVLHFRSESKTVHLDNPISITISH